MAQTEKARDGQTDEAEALVLREGGPGYVQRVQDHRRPPGRMLEGGHLMVRGDTWEERLKRMDKALEEIKQKRLAREKKAREDRERKNPRRRS